ncbi:hypothetical protein KP79_PYT25638 [Mizuhopecten yessoensis]|uniref:Endonuclease/exonuclease/phosphatase domain-containing protein n=1 Tax=Mizuhopecten yessoensis TaxID=6573 RepID=A0A210R5M7_MIZYE|nr:hypothetical protein KP79_PYT25638 [Mizuhopecten yessoensis]
MICLEQYRYTIGIWSFYSFMTSVSKNIRRKPRFKSLHNCTHPASVSVLLCICYLLFLLLLNCGDVQPNPGPNKLNYLSFCHINARSILATTDESNSRYYKLDEIESVLCNDFMYDIIAISETCLCPEIEDSILQLENFKRYRNDRNRHGGGVAICIRNTIKCKRRLDLESPNIESLVLEITHQTGNILFSIIYRPPNQDARTKNDFLTYFSDTVQKMRSENPINIIITGYFNDRCTAWDDQHVTSELRRRFFNIAIQNNLSQLINKATHFTENSSHILDLIFVDKVHFVANVDIKSPLCNLDHSSISCKLKYYVPKPQSYQRTIWDYKTADIDGLNNAFNTAHIDIFFGVFNLLDYIIDNVNKFILDTCKTFIINKVVNIRPRDKPWLTNEVRRAFRTRDRYYKLF